jgi:thioredoxin-related protein
MMELSAWSRLGQPRAKRSEQRRVGTKRCINPQAIRRPEDFCNPELGNCEWIDISGAFRKEFFIALGALLRERRLMKVTRFLPLFIAMFLLSALPAFAGGWGDNYTEALATAAKENKKVLLDFTGSDWCGWCIKTKKEVFDQPQFKDFADKNLVLVEVDFPQRRTLSPEVKKQNDALQEQYRVEGFPTLVLLDPQGKLLKENVGYLSGGPQGFINWVNAAK